MYNAKILINYAFAVSLNKFNVSFSRLICMESKNLFHFQIKLIPSGELLFDYKLQVTVPLSVRISVKFYTLQEFKKLMLKNCLVFYANS